MSKKKLALLVFCLAFGLNIFAFVFSKKTFQVEEVKNVWLYELPLSASPLDAYVALDLGPHQGVVGSLFVPNELPGEHALVPLLADTWKWNDKNHELRIGLKPGLSFSNHDPIKASDFVNAHRYLASQTSGFATSPAWSAWAQADYRADGETLVIQLNHLSENFDLETFLSEVLTHPLSGPIHAHNLESLQKGEHPTKDWLSSGPYRIRKWNPKEIELISRDDFPVMMRKDFFRTLKFQSAPVKNPSCDFMQARAGDEKTLAEHNTLVTQNQLSIFWICRSFQEESFCKNSVSRAILAGLLSGNLSPSPELLKGQKLRYRIPTGSDEFRASIRSRIEERVKAAGGEVEETSYFFKSSKETDLELEFVFSPQIEKDPAFAQELALLSSRMGPASRGVSNLAGLIDTYPINILMKTSKGEVFPKVFIEADLDEKKLPL